MIAEPPKMLLNPLHRVLRAYDRAIGACDDRSFVAAYRGISLLRASLELDSPPSIGFDGIFAWCEDAISGGDFDAAARHLRALRDAWAMLDVEEPQAQTRGRSTKPETVVLQFMSTANDQARA